MKNRIAICIVSIAATFGSLAVAQPDPAVDWEKVQNNSFVEWLEYLNVPSPSALQSRAVEKSAARAEIADLKKVARKVFNPALGLSDTAIEQNVIPVPELLGKDDVLLVEQKIPAARVIVMDARFVNILVDPETTSSVSLDKESLQEHVENVARSILNIPSAEQIGKDLTFFVSALEIGNSKTGSIQFGRDSSPNQRWQHWYAYIGWWSDGERVMFQIDKYGILHPDEDLSRRALAPKEYTEPRKFGRAE